MHWIAFRGFISTQLKPLPLGKPQPRAAQNLSVSIHQDGDGRLLQENPSSPAAKGFRAVLRFLYP